MQKLTYLLLISICVISFSCSEKYNIEEGISGIYIEASKSYSLVNDSIALTVRTEGESGEDVSELATIYANGEEISSPYYTTDNLGKVTFRAEYLNLESEAAEVVFHDGTLTTNYVKRVLVEDYTGTWCGWCTRLSDAIKKVDEQTDKAVFVAIHRAPSGTQDPYNYEEAAALEQTLSAAGYPKGFLNRLTQWEFPENENIGQALALTQGANPKLGLKMDSSLDENTIELNVDVEFAQDFENLKMVVYILENGLVYPQVNYSSSLYGGENPVEDYVHDYTLRETLTHILGDEVPVENTRLGQSYTRNFQFTIPENIENTSNIDFVAFIVDEDGHALNSRKSSLGESQEYEVIE
ncbi:MAG: Omp28-related outer membrane protein [Psychroflexus sp.]|jgi:thiol-disulfide isomerase/thioredoxin|nr:Omp28-related outer membrane protein [Psychroflexus sp.]